MFRITARHDQAFGEAKFSRLKKSMEEKYRSQCRDESCSISDLYDEGYELGFRMEHQLDEYVRLMVVMTHYPAEFEPVSSAKSLLKDQSRPADVRLHFAAAKLETFYG